jgi:hypothetical protein
MTRGDTEIVLIPSPTGGLARRPGRWISADGDGKRSIRSECGEWAPDGGGGLRPGAVVAQENIRAK